MKALALDKARSRMRSAARAFDALKEAQSEQEFQDHWLDFLAAWKGAYINVKKAATDTAQERQWFGAVALERRSDPLLNWLFEARNDEEHGLVASAVLTPSVYGFRATASGQGRFAVNQKGEVSFVGLDGEPMAEVVKFIPGENKLQPVRDRGGNEIAAPTSHVGKPMEPTPIHAAHHGLLYIRALVRMAAVLGEP